MCISLTPDLAMSQAIEGLKIGKSSNMTALRSEIILIANERALRSLQSAERLPALAWQP